MNNNRRRKIFRSLTKITKGFAINAHRSSGHRLKRFHAMLSILTKIDPLIGNAGNDKAVRLKHPYCGCANNFVREHASNNRRVKDQTGRLEIVYRI